MPQTLNFDAITCDYIDIIKREQTFHLRDDVPDEIMLRVFLVDPSKMTLNDVPREDRALARKIVGERMEAFKAEVAGLVGDIFRHTLPETTDEQIRSLFTIIEQEQIIQLFFLRASPRFKKPQGATPPAQTSTKKRNRHRGRSRGATS